MIVIAVCTQLYLDHSIVKIRSSSVYKNHKVRFFLNEVLAFKNVSRAYNSSSLEMNANMEQKFSSIRSNTPRTKNYEGVAAIGHHKVRGY